MLNYEIRLYIQNFIYFLRYKYVFKIIYCIGL